MPQLNIKDSETHALANELARRRGVSAARAVKTALKEVLSNETASSTPDAISEGNLKFEEVMAFVREGAKYWPENLSVREAMDSLYDEDGFPA